MSYINDPGNEVPENTIAIFSYENNGYSDEVIVPLPNMAKREWFPNLFYQCLPMVIGNQFGFGIKSLHSFTAYLDKDGNKVHFKYDEEYDTTKQEINNHFEHGVITVTNRFILRTPPGINLVATGAPNSPIQNLYPLTGVIETDNLRMSFTFNLKVLSPDIPVRVNKGDLLASFFPIPRYFVENFKLKDSKTLFSDEIHQNEWEEIHQFGRVRNNENAGLTNDKKRFYFKGNYALGGKFKDHQKRV
jgi:hypothetical protein